MLLKLWYNTNWSALSELEGFYSVTHGDAVLLLLLQTRSENLMAAAASPPGP